MPSQSPGEIKVGMATSSEDVGAFFAAGLTQVSDIALWNAGVDPLELLSHPDRLAEMDVIVLGVGPSRMDARLLLKRFRLASAPPIIVVATGAELGAETAMEFFTAGASEVIAVVDYRSTKGAVSPLDRLITSIRGVVRGSSPRVARVTVPREPLPRTVKAVSPRLVSSVGPLNPRQILVIGASTGGTEAIRHVLAQLPADMPGICIVQHIPAAFSRCFAARLNDQCAMEVHEAQDGEIVRPGLALVAPGGFHMELRWCAIPGQYQVHLHQGPPEHYQRPAVDVLFRSAARAAGQHALSVLLTGMGKDGALGMKDIREAGGGTLAQDEKTSVVFGMPKSARDLGVVESMVPLPEMASTILRRLKNQPLKA